MSLTPRQKRLEDQRRQREREQRQQQQHQHVPDWGEYERHWSQRQRRFGQFGQFGQPRYGPYPEAARTAAAGGDGAAGGGFDWSPTDWEPTEPLPCDSDGDSSSSNVSDVVAVARRSWLGADAEGDGIDAVFPGLSAYDGSGSDAGSGGLDGSSGSDAGSAAAAAARRRAWQAPGAGAGAAADAAGSVGGVEEDADVLRSLLAGIDVQDRELVELLLASRAAADAGADAAGVDRSDVLRRFDAERQLLMEECEWLDAEAGGSVLDRLDDFNDFEPLAEETDSAQQVL